MEDGSIFSVSSVANSALDSVCRWRSPAARNQQCLTTAVPGHKIVPVAGRTPPVSRASFRLRRPGSPRLKARRHRRPRCRRSGTENKRQGIFCARTRVARKLSDNARSLAASCFCWPCDCTTRIPETFFLKRTVHLTNFQPCLSVGRRAQTAVNPRRQYHYRYGA